MRKYLPALAAAAALVAPVAVAAPASAAVAFPQCRYEDSNGPCWWDANNRGDGRGMSFWVGSDGRVHDMRIPDVTPPKKMTVVVTWDGRSTTTLTWRWWAHY